MITLPPPPDHDQPISVRARVRGTHVSHQTIQQRGVEPCIQLAPKHGRRDVKAAPDLALGKAVHELGGVVRELARRAVRLGEFLAGNHAESEQKSGDDGCDQRRRGTHPGLVDIVRWDVLRIERCDARQRGDRRGQVQLLKLIGTRQPSAVNFARSGYLCALGVEIIVTHGGDIEAVLQRISQRSGRSNGQQTLRS